MVADVMMNIYAYLAVFPYVPFIVIWILVMVMFRDAVIATRTSCDITTFFLLGANAALINLCFSTNLGLWIIVTSGILAFGLLGGMQRRIRGTNQLGKLIRKLWRMSFILLSLSYVIFIIFSLSRMVIHA